MNKLLSIPSLSFYCCCLFFTKISYGAQSNIDSVETDIETIEIVNSHEFNSVNYQVLHREDLINSAQTLSDALKNINGIQIRQISGLGNPVSISIRGSSGKQVQMYIDGQLVNDSQFGGFDLNQIPTDQIESIEISKSQALGTGSTPIGGVIRVNTYNPSENKKKIALSIGSFGYKEVNFLSNNAFKKHSLAFGGNYLVSDNDYNYLVPQSFVNPSESINEPLRNNEFEKLSLFVNDNVQLDQHQLRFNLQYNKQEKALANYQNNSPENSSTLDSDQIRYSIQHYWLADINSLGDINFEGIEINYSGETKDELYLERPNEDRIKTSDYKNTKQQISIKPNINWSTLSFTPFVDISRQNFSSFSTQNGEAIQCNGISSCDVEAAQTQINFGARIEWKSDSYPISSYILGNQLREKNANSALNAIDSQKETKNTHYSTQELGINYGTGNLNTSVNFSNGIRTPTLFELFGDRGSFKGNGNLLPEEANTITLGLQYQVKQFNLSSSLYRQDLENSIVAIFNSSGVGSYTNVGGALLNGFELQGNISLLDNLSLSMQVSLIDSDTSSPFIAFDNKKLPGIYHQQYSASLLYKIKPNWQIKINSSLDKELYFNRNNQFQSTNSNLGSGNPADRSLTNIALNWQTPKYNASLSFNNVFNEKYQDLANRPAQGKSIQLKFSIEDL
ncbi:TonB-dependent receptor [Colwellia sp. 1_MG-2023]|uniref:TonB-dependent receptor n=1 Tax=unclassified Colwellia TaxID=196834 RepID=UPI001C0A3AAF|nr:MULTISPECIES: TonB-dependent receptor [unclassified Colwellia]MBU2925443.1 TonB-dependent receptor [Colwellia sp. C2M11]MDO6651589.1 TonB-dependent receptor [Colwellia sp. 3_MG-2023]MDO6665013.1 TonB-dependent receptor [Colwellia sp. 2_MG-2023]MDO6689386.1 TonB-dependent receptor [Colwellia sp. 1_MG-2023]